MAVTAYPCYSLENAKLDRGVCCKGCQFRLELLLGEYSGERDKVFSRRGFLSQFAQCEETQDLWAESEGKTRPANEPELALRYGYFIFNPLGSLDSRAHCVTPLERVLFKLPPMRHNMYVYFDHAKSQGPLNH